LIRAFFIKSGAGADDVAELRTIDVGCGTGCQQEREQQEQETHACKLLFVGCNEKLVFSARVLMIEFWRLIEGCSLYGGDGSGGIWRKVRGNEHAHVGFSVPATFGRVVGTEPSGI
jgi:hypothetical protein